MTTEDEAIPEGHARGIGANQSASKSLAHTDYCCRPLANGRNYTFGTELSQLNTLVGVIEFALTSWRSVASWPPLEPPDTRELLIHDLRDVRAVLSANEEFGHYADPYEWTGVTALDSALALIARLIPDGHEFRSIPIRLGNLRAAHRWQRGEYEEPVDIGSVRLGDSLAGFWLEDATACSSMFSKGRPPIMRRRQTEADLRAREEEVDAARRSALRASARPIARQALDVLRTLYERLDATSFDEQVLLIDRTSELVDCITPMDSADGWSLSEVQRHLNEARGVVVRFSGEVAELDDDEEGQYDAGRRFGSLMDHELRSCLDTLTRFAADIPTDAR